MGADSDIDDLPRKQTQISSVSELVQSIIQQFEVSAGSTDTVAEKCSQILEHITFPLNAADSESLQTLSSLLNKRSGPIAGALFDFLETVLAQTADPWLLLTGMLSARDGSLALRALKLTIEYTSDQRLGIDRPKLKFLAKLTDPDQSALHDPDALKMLRTIVCFRLSEDSEMKSDPLLQLFLKEKDHLLRRFAARLLDATDQPVSSATSETLLGKENAAFLEPYLVYSRATHLDFLSLAVEPTTVFHLVESLRRVEETCGKALLQNIITELGWPRINAGISVRRFEYVSISGSLPLVLSPAEAYLFKNCEGVQSISELYLLTVQGTFESNSISMTGKKDLVGRFRAYNLVHAALLEDLLDMNPLKHEKTEQIIEKMNRIVEDYTILFKDMDEECSILEGVYKELTGKIRTELNSCSGAGDSSPELTRLVRMFEDPGSLGEVRTLHGLKRYLHQRGLRLGFRLVETAEAPNRTIDLIAADHSGILGFVKGIRYVDFEHSTADTNANSLPYPVALLIEALSRQLLYGKMYFPRVDIFCYGMEVHYYVTFRNHPVFIRINYSPPLRGGMIDLEYFGVSNYELSMHPDISLNAIRTFFREIDFHIQIEGVHVHARYDKERVFDLGTFVEKIKELFNLIPYLMDIDWIIGSLDLLPESKPKVAAAWAESFKQWGVLPVDLLLSKDRLGILCGVETRYGKPCEILWSGKGSYEDRFNGPPPPKLLDQINSILNALQLDAVSLPYENCLRPLGYRRLEDYLFKSFRETLSRGELVETAQGIRPAPKELYQRMHEAEVFAGIIVSGVSEVTRAAAVGHLAVQLERMLDFVTSGSVEECEVQRARLTLPDQECSLYILRDHEGIVRLAAFAESSMAYRRRRNTKEPWQSNISIDHCRFEILLRKYGYLSMEYQLLTQDIESEAEAFLTSLQKKDTRFEAGIRSGEQVVQGLKASPGRIVGRVKTEISSLHPEDTADIILVLSTVGPGDNAFIYHSAGIVATGGGPLSHAGLIALQYHKPALIINGRWIKDENGRPALLCPVWEFEEHKQLSHGLTVITRDNISRRFTILREGDLAVLDADKSCFIMLGRDRDVLAIHEGLLLLTKTSHELTETANEGAALCLRGRRIQSLYKIEKHLSRIHEPDQIQYILSELLQSRLVSSRDIDQKDAILLLKRLMQKSNTGTAARKFLVQTMRDLDLRYRTIRESARRSIPHTDELPNLLSVRLEAHRLNLRLRRINKLLLENGIESPVQAVADLKDIDSAALWRLQEMRVELIKTIRHGSGEPSAAVRLRHTLHHLDRLNKLTSTATPVEADIERLRAELKKTDKDNQVKSNDAFVLHCSDCGHELAPLIGWKAANLGEVQRIAGSDIVPPWFVVTDRAFSEVMETPPAEIASDCQPLGNGGATMRKAIDHILKRNELDDNQQSELIRKLWENAVIPEDLLKKILDGYKSLCRNAAQENFSPESDLMTAVRSSGCEEDTEEAARAGEFETYLCIGGKEALIEYLKRAWGGLWTARAIRSRRILGTESHRVSGGIIIQRIVRTRVSGVLMTVNVPDNNMSEMVISAGLGLGEGIVSGRIAADQFVVDKTSILRPGSLRFRCITSDKNEQVVFDQKAGQGTRVIETLSHQRLRSALEYHELSELATTALRLEQAFRYPLDIEFAIEGTRLWILQVRPVTSFLSAVRETVECFPLSDDSNIDELTIKESAP